MIQLRTMDANRPVSSSGMSVTHVAGGAHKDHFMYRDQPKGHRVSQWRNWDRIPNWCSLCGEPHNGWFVHTGKRDHHCFEIILDSLIQHDRRWCAREVWLDLHRWLSAPHIRGRLSCSTHNNDNSSNKHHTNSTYNGSKCNDEDDDNRDTTNSHASRQLGDGAHTHTNQTATHDSLVCAEQHRCRRSHAHGRGRVDHRPYTGDLGPPCQSPLLSFQAAYAAHAPAQRRRELIGCLLHLRQHGHLNIHRGNVHALSTNGCALLQKELIPRTVQLFPATEARYLSSLMAKLCALGNMDLVYDVCRLDLVLPDDVAAMYSHPSSSRAETHRRTRDTLRHGACVSVTEEEEEEEEGDDGSLALPDTDEAAAAAATLPLSDEAPVPPNRTAGAGCETPLLPATAKTLLCTALLGALRWSVDVTSPIAPWTRSCDSSASSSLPHSRSGGACAESVVAVLASQAAQMLVSELVACFMMEQVSRLEGQLRTEAAAAEMAMLVQQRLPLRRRTGPSVCMENGVRAVTMRSGSFRGVVGRGGHRHDVLAHVVPKMPHANVRKSVMSVEGGTGRAVYRSVSPHRLYLRKMPSTTRLSP